MGKGKNPQTAAQEHTSRPLTSLKDPNAFGPPPKNVNYHGGAAVPNAITPDRRGWGSPLTAEEIQAKEDEERRQEEAAKKPAPPPVPYRVDTTGIDTRNLPKPPIRRFHPEDGEQTQISTKPKPSLPPRLPPRQNSRPNLHAPDPPPSYSAATQSRALENGDFNVGALNRLGKAGVSVPSFGIGKKPTTPTAEPNPPNPWQDQTSPAASPTNTHNPSLSGLQSRFSKLSTASPTPPSTSSPASGGTTLAQKQDALHTASAFQKDPSSISLADAKATASTANNFRERHGEQVAAGGKWAGAMNKKYDVTNRVNGYAGANAALQSPSHEATTSPWADEPSAGNNHSAQAAVAAAAFKKAPPPPVPAARKPGPPPVPLGSKPRG